jgi:hypothetical protein
MGGNYNTFVGRGPATVEQGGWERWVDVVDLRLTTDASTSGLLWLFVIQRLFGNPNTPGIIQWEWTRTISAGEGIRIEGEECPLGGDPEPTIWEIWIGEGNHQFYEVYWVYGNSMTLTSTSKSPLYPDDMRCPHGPLTDQYVDTHLRTSGGRNIKIVSHTIRVWNEGWSDWTLTVGEGINLADYYSYGDEVRIVPRFSGRDIGVRQHTLEMNPRPFRRG